MRWGNERNIASLERLQTVILETGRTNSFQFYNQGIMLNAKFKGVWEKWKRVKDELISGDSMLSSSSIFDPLLLKIYYAPGVFPGNGLFQPVIATVTR